jgi:hypothetical protein
MPNDVITFEFKTRREEGHLITTTASLYLIVYCTTCFGFMERQSSGTTKILFKFHITTGRQV